MTARPDFVHRAGRGRWLLPVLLWAALGSSALAAGQATIYVGRAAAPAGGEALVEISLGTTGGALVSALQFDLQFDSNVLEVKSAEVGESADRAGKDVVFASTVPGTARFLVIGNNDAAIPQGAIIELTLLVDASAPAGPTALVGSNPVASSPDSQPVLAVIEDGRVTIAGGLFQGCCGWVIPAAAHAPGVGGSVWRTDLSIENLGPTAAEIELQFVPSQTDGSNVVGVPVSVASGELVTIDDVVGQLFDLDSGVGAIFADVDDLSIRLGSRTYNVGSAAGTYGQGIPALAVDELITEGELVSLFPVASQSGFRTNLGLINAAGFAASVTVVLVDSKGIEKHRETFSLLPWSHRQINDLTTTWGVALTQGDGRLRLEVETAGARIGAYLSVVDSGTGDPTYHGFLR